jgi:putative hydrolase of the HAD superfamily
MQPEPRAILFDLDDTLYPLRSFVRSGFVACAEFLHRAMGLDPREVLLVLLAASDGPDRGRELQVCAEQFGLTDAIVGTLVDVIRHHDPTLRLPRASREVLAALRGRWRLGVVTNGLPDLQARKAKALGLPRLVDTIVYANALGDGRGKPQPEPFLEAARRLSVSPDRTLFVGDDLRCDMFGAGQVGMRTVQLERQHNGRSPKRIYVDTTISSLYELLRVAEPLVPTYRSSHVA